MSKKIQKLTVKVAEMLDDYFAREELGEELDEDFINTMDDEFGDKKGYEASIKKITKLIKLKEDKPEQFYMLILQYPDGEKVEMKEEESEEESEEEESEEEESEEEDEDLKKNMEAIAELKRKQKFIDQREYYLLNDKAIQIMENFGLLNQSEMDDMDGTEFIGEDTEEERYVQKLVEEINDTPLKSILITYDKSQYFNLEEVEQFKKYITEKRKQKDLYNFNEARQQLQKTIDEAKEKDNRGILDTMRTFELPDGGRIMVDNLPNMFDDATP
jgi:hypothetical protein